MRFPSDTAKARSAAGGLAPDPSRWGFPSDTASACWAVAWISSRSTALAVPVAARLAVPGLLRNSLSLEEPRHAGILSARTSPQVPTLVEIFQCLQTFPSLEASICFLGQVPHLIVDFASRSARPR